MKLQVLLSWALAGLAAAKPLLHSREYAVKEYHPVPPSFTWESEAPKSHVLRLSVGLRQSRFDELERHLYEVSDPDHPRYGQHLAPEEVHELVQPSAEALELVHAWLAEHDVEASNIEYSPARDFLTFAIPVDRAERLLNTQYSVYRHQDGTPLVRTPEWALPMHLHEHIETIQPTNSFLRAMPQTRLIATIPEQADVEAAAAGGDAFEKVCHRGSITPKCLSTLYGTVNYTPKSNGKAQVALNDFLGEINNRSDAAIYLNKFRPSAIAGAQGFKQISVNGGTLQQTPENATQLAAGTGLEGGLDVQTILGISWPVPLTAYSTGGSPPFKPDFSESTDENEPYLTWLQYILKQSFIPQVVSNSYEDDEQTVPPSYANSVCKGFAQLGARGVSVFFGSGDGGVTGVQTNNECLSNKNQKVEYIPCFPSSCPYVTSVGATVNFSPEKVAYDPSNGFNSGGGFSNYFGQPSYQAAAVDGYLKEIGSLHSQYYNKSGRAYPDIAAYGVNFTIAWDGKLLNLDGTSASTPTAAAVFALVNDALIAEGKAPLGFLNPWLYKKGYQAFTDVTEGRTFGCNTTGFPATKGWDVASGFGTPQFSKILQLAGSASGYN